MKFVPTLPIFFVLIMLASVTQAQTRKIAHRSHSGVPATFAFFMDEDHLGGPMITFPRPALELNLGNYDVKPWIDSLKRKYQPAAEAAGAEPTMPHATPQDSLNASPQPKQKLRSPKGKHPAEAAQSMPPNDEGSTAQMSNATTGPHSSTATRNSVGLLLALLLFPVAPAVFLLSAVWSSQRKVA